MVKRLQLGPIADKGVGYFISNLFNRIKRTDFKNIILA
jgi:hypothetical protein